MTGRIMAVSLKLFLYWIQSHTTRIPARSTSDSHSAAIIGPNAACAPGDSRSLRTARTSISIAGRAHNSSRSFSVLVPELDANSTRVNSTEFIFYLVAHTRAPFPPLPKPHVPQPPGGEAQSHPPPPQAERRGRGASAKRRGAGPAARPAAVNPRYKAL